MGRRLGCEAAIASRNDKLWRVIGGSGIWMPRASRKFLSQFAQMLLDPLQAIFHVLLVVSCYREDDGQD